MSQNLASPARTLAPEIGLWMNLNLLQDLTLDLYAIPILRHLPSERDFFRHIHRFHGESFEDFCRLCKELHRTVSEQIDIGAINESMDPANAAEANQKKLREIKRLAFWLTNIGHDGHKMTEVLAGVCDLRIGDAHAASGSARDSLKLIGIPPDRSEYLAMCWHVIAEVANSIARTCEAIAPNRLVRLQDIDKTEGF